MKNRELFIGIIFSTLFCVIAARATYLHVIKHEWLAEKAESQYSRTKIATGKRGTIFDVNNNVLALSSELTSVGADPSQYPAENKAAEIRDTSNKLGKILGINAWNLRKKLLAGKSFTWIKKKVPPAEANEIKSLKSDPKKNKWIVLQEDHNRYYPNCELAGQVLGFTGTDEKGLEGIEFQFNNDLQAPVDKYMVTKDAHGQCFRTDTDNPVGFTGNSLTLTIDRQIQYAAECALKDAALEYKAKSGIAVVMRPQNGELLAIAHYPQFNPNSFNDYSREVRRNRAVTDPFEPGSTLKVILASAAIDTRICTPTSSFYCENGSYKVGGNRVNDTHPYEWLSLSQIIKYSSNIGAVKISEIMGRKTLYTFLTRFGFGRPTGIDCPGESSGILSNYSNWSSIDSGAIAFGQGISVSAVQLVTAVSAIANGGYLVKPHIVKSVNDPEGKVVRHFDSLEKKQVISKETSEKVKDMMANVVEDGGTGVNAALNGYTVCGKTGTAQKIGTSGGYAKGSFTSSFIGFAPKSHPEVTVLVLLDEPKAAHYGGTVAAPAFKKIIYETLNYLNIEPEKDTNDASVLLAQRNEAKQ